MAGKSTRKEGRRFGTQEGRCPGPSLPCPERPFSAPTRGRGPWSASVRPLVLSPTLLVPGPRLKEFEILVQSHRPKPLTAHVGWSGIVPSSAHICWSQRGPSGGDGLRDSPSPPATPAL